MAEVRPLRSPVSGGSAEYRPMKVLIVEDNADIVANVRGYLAPKGYEIDSARTGVAGLAMAAEGSYDVVLLDLTLPGMDGIDVCKKLRQEYDCSTPILMLTARDSLQDKVVGFTSGADDYLVKPFTLEELELRIMALERRSRGHSSRAVMSFADLSYDTGTREARRANVQLSLTPIGHKILIALLRRAPNVVSREDLEFEVWGYDRPDSDALRSHIHSLRQTLDKPFTTQLLKTLPGLGYRLADSDV